VQFAKKKNSKNLQKPTQKTFGFVPKIKKKKYYVHQNEIFSKNFKIMRKTMHFL
jgi:hypothetical protein